MATYPNPKFVDHFPGHTDHGYSVSNEEPYLFNELLGKRRFRKAISICSSGEILLGVVAPRATQVVAVDHSYRSLAGAYAKALALLKEDRARFVENVTQGKIADLDATLSGLKSALPATLQPYPLVDTYERYRYKYAWAKLDEPIQKIGKRRLANIQFLHGDLQDALNLYGQCDLLYVSNAIDHKRRYDLGGKRLTLEDFAQFLTPKGVLIGVGYQIAIVHETEHFKPLANPKIGKNSSWSHSALERK